MEAGSKGKAIAERLPPNAGASSGLPLSPLDPRSSPKNIRHGITKTYSGISSRMRASNVDPALASSGNDNNKAKSASPQDGTETFRQSLSISLDEPVGSMSISPSNRDVALGARKGLFIVDLENPFDQPRFLAHSATWDVADVQWSIHPARSNWIVSTSSQKALVWNLDFPHSSDVRSLESSSSYTPSQSPIEFVLDAHTRAICDINWSVFNPDVLATCGMDSCVISWDLRTGGRSPSQTFCAWGSPATQVKWNRQDPHLIASSHDTRVLVWDTRKAALPVVEIKAHSQKIYGIDWSRRSAENIITCSLDKSVRFWSTRTPAEPNLTINTPSPVWRARHLPFGRGVLTLPQRHDATLQLWAKDRPIEPVATFAGHADTVHEFVWRVRGGADLACDDREFQLVTWGKDRKLRLWPVADDVLRSVGHRPGAPIDVRITRQGSTNRSYRRSSLLTPFTPSSPSYMSPAPFRGGHAGSAASTSASPQERRMPVGPSARRDVTSRQFRRAGVMTRAVTTATRPHAEERLAWMEGVKLFKKGDTGLDAPQVTVGPLRSARSLSPPIATSSAVESSEAEPQNLGEELRAVARKLSRVTFENLAVQARTCSVGLYGPWASRHGVAFLRATFTFPKGYPTRKPPTIDIERSADISARTRAWLLKAARAMMQKHVEDDGSPSLEACLRFLLGEEEDSKKEDEAGIGSDSDPDSGDEGDIPLSRIRPEVLRNNDKVPLPRRSGACFGPQGQLVIFFSANSGVNTHDIHESPRYQPPQNVKFEAFGTLASTLPADGASDTSESDDALLLSGSRRLTLSGRAPRADAPPISTPRRISTDLTILRLPLLTPWSAGEHFSRSLGDGLPLILRTLMAKGDGAVSRIMNTLDHLLTLRLDAPADAQSRWLLLGESFNFLTSCHDLEALGIVAIALGTLRRGRQPGINAAIASKSERPDYFSARPPHTPAVYSPAVFGTPQAISGHSTGAASLLSPSKGSWGSLGALFSNSVLSVRTGSPLELPGDVANGSLRPPNSSLLAVTTPSHEDAVAVLKHLVSQEQPSRRTGSLPGPPTSASPRSPESPKVALHPAKSSPMRRKKRRVCVKLLEASEDRPQLPRFDAVAEAQLELHRHALAENFMRRGDPITRTVILQSLQANEKDAAGEALLRYRAKMATGLDASTRVELGALCPTCGSRLDPATRRCFRCSRTGVATICTLCRTKVEGISHNCGICLHGGHVVCMQSWFAQTLVCPAGCDCNCATDGGLAGAFGVPASRQEADNGASAARGEERDEVSASAQSLATLHAPTPSSRLGSTRRR